MRVPGHSGAGSERSGKARRDLTNRRYGLWSAATGAQCNPQRQNKTRHGAAFASLVFWATHSRNHSGPEGQHKQEAPPSTQRSRCEVANLLNQMPPREKRRRKKERIHIDSRETELT